MTKIRPNQVKNTTKLPKIRPLYDQFSRINEGKVRRSMNHATRSSSKFCLYTKVKMDFGVGWIMWQDLHQSLLLGEGKNVGKTKQISGQQNWVNF